MLQSCSHSLFLFWTFCCFTCLNLGYFFAFFINGTFLSFDFFCFISIQPGPILYIFLINNLSLFPESVRKPEVHTFILYIYYFYVCGFYILLYLSFICIHLIYFFQFIPLFITYMATVGFLCNIKGLIQPPRGKAEGEILLMKLTKHHVNHYTYFFSLNNQFISN